MNGPRSPPRQHTTPPIFQTAASETYRDWFVDPRLVALIDSAIANNRDLVAATARIEQARTQYRI